MCVCVYTYCMYDIRTVSDIFNRMSWRWKSGGVREAEEEDQEVEFCYTIHYAANKEEEVEFFYTMYYVA